MCFWYLNCFALNQSGIFSEKWIWLPYLEHFPPAVTEHYISRNRRKVFKPFRKHTSVLWRMQLLVEKITLAIYTTVAWLPVITTDLTAEEIFYIVQQNIQIYQQVANQSWDNENSTWLKRICLWVLLQQLSILQVSLSYLWHCTPGGKDGGRLSLVESATGWL